MYQCPEWKPDEEASSILVGVELWSIIKMDSSIILKDYLLGRHFAYSSLIASKNQCACSATKLFDTTSKTRVRRDINDVSGLYHIYQCLFLNGQKGVSHREMHFYFFHF